MGGEGREGRGRQSDLFSTIILGLTIEEEWVGRGGGEENEKGVEGRKGEMEGRRRYSRA